MTRRQFAIAAAAFGLGRPFSRAAAADPVTDADRVAGLLKGLLLAHLPTPLVSANHGWGHQREAVVGLKWHGLRAEAQRSLRNDGHWRRVRFEAVNPATTLALGVRDLKSPEAGRVTFEAHVGLDTRVTYEQQLWRTGHRLYSGETRARCRTAVRLGCEVTSRLEAKPGSLLPAAVFRVRVTEAEVFYANLVCEHTLGVGGDAAKLIGQAVHDTLTRVKPSVERDLLAKANAAIVKAADTREVRVEFDRLVGGRKG